MGREAGPGIAGSSADVSQVEMKMSRTHFKAQSGCWQNSLLYGYRTEVTFSLLVIGQSSLLAPRGYSPVLVHGPLHLQRNRGAASLSQALDLSEFSFCQRPEKTLCFQRDTSN